MHDKSFSVNAFICFSVDSLATHNNFPFWLSTAVDSDRTDLTATTNGESSKLSAVMGILPL